MRVRGLVLGERVGACFGVQLGACFWFAVGDLFQARGQWSVLLSLDRGCGLTRQVEQKRTFIARPRLFSALFVGAGGLYLKKKKSLGNFSAARQIGRQF